MAEIQSIEQLLYFMKGHIHLSRYDEKFIDNIATLTTVTTNQVVLFHTLIHKYQRQFAKHEMFVDKLVNLPWNVNVVESSPQYTEGYLSIIDDYIYFRCPFNRNFIDEFRKLSLNSFTWDKQKRQYHAPYNIYSLKILLDTAYKFFPSIHFCEVSQKMIDEVKIYEDAIYWQPTLVRRNGNLYILASNSALDDALGDTVLVDNVDTYHKLSRYGVSIGPDIHMDDPKLKFICESVTTVEQSNINDMITWLKEINCDLVIISGGANVNLMKKKLIEQLNTCNGMEYLDTAITIKPTVGYKNPVLVKLKRNFDYGHQSVHRVTKVIYLTNSTPIDIK